MTDLRTAAQQALEALEASSGCLAFKNIMCRCSEMCRSYTAAQHLRTALAQQAEPVEQMPVGWLESPHGAFRADPLYKMQFPSQLLQWQIALYTAPPQQAEPDAYGYASRLAVAIWEKHYKDVAPQWKPLDDLMGVLTQIDNMTSGLTRLAQQAESVAVTDRLARHGIPMPEEENPSFG